MSAEQTSALSICEYLLATVEDCLEVCGSEPLNRVHVAAGLLAWDDCCGMLVAGPERVYRTASFPVEGSDDAGCFDGLIAVDVVVLLVRCVPVIDNEGRVPAPEVLGGAYSEIVNDAAIIWNCLSGQLPEGWDRANLNQTFVGAEGGCIGVETRLAIGVEAELFCPVCPEVTP